MTSAINHCISRLRHGQVPKKGCQVTRLGIAPNDWMMFRIGDCLERVERPVDVQADKLYTQIGIRSHGKGLFYKEPVTGAELGNKAVFWIEPNCFILNIVFAWEQAIAKTTQAEEGLIGSHRFPMYRPINNRVDTDYLIYYFLTKRGREILEAASPGGAGRNKTLGQERFLKSKIVLPPLAEQRKIAKILATQDKVIELKEKRLAEKLRQKKYLMQQLLTGKKRLNGFSGEWEVKCLCDACYLVTKCTTGELCDYVSTENMAAELKNNVCFEDSQQERQGIEFVKGDILIANIRPYLKKVWKATKCGVCSADVLVLRPTSVSSEFLYRLIANDDFFSYVMIAAKGSKMPRGDKKHIMSMPITLPIFEKEQMAISKFMNTVDNELELFVDELTHEKQKKKALIQLLLTGIVRVKEAAGSRFSTQMKERT